MTNNGLPKGWASSTTSEVAEVQLGKMLDKLKRTKGKRLPYLRNQNVRWSEFDLSDVLEMPFEEHEMQRYAVEPGDLIVCEGGEPGRAAVWMEAQTEIKYQKALHRVRPCNGISAYWILYHLLFDAQTERLSAHFTGTTIKHFTQSAFSRYPLHIPPREEQLRIVDKLKELTLWSQRAREALDAIPPLLERFRQSVLAAAFRGDLTADWRSIHKHSKGTAELAGRGVPPATFDDLPQLPDGWHWATVGDVGDVQGGIQKQPKRRPVTNAFPFLRVANVYRGRLELHDVHRIELFDGELEKLRLQRGDLLVVEGNGSADEIGRMAIWDGSIEDCVHQNHLIRVRLKAGILPELVEAFWASPLGRAKVFEKAQTTTGLYNLGTKKVSQLPVPVPPMAEQHALVNRLRESLGSVARIESLTDAKSSMLNRLDQSILAKAFRGELVPQDPNDEPASVLLERIRAERNATGNGQKRAGTRRGRRSAAHEPS